MCDGKVLMKLVGSFVNTKGKSFLGYFDSFEDMYSECLLYVVLRLPKFNEKVSTLSNFVYLCCRSCCLGKVRVKKQRRYDGVTVSLDTPFINDEDTDLVLGDMVGEEDKGISELEAEMTVAELMPFINKETRMFYFENLTQKEIAERTGTTQSNVSRKIRECIRRLRAVMFNHLSPADLKKLKEEQIIIDQIMREHHCSERTAYKIFEKQNRKIV